LSKNEYLSKFVKYYGHKVMDDAVSIAVLPRMRLGRRPDKNWSEQNYRKLIASLQDSFKKIGR
jgi:ADP-heptose:LPS heptosyltransferase